MEFIIEVLILPHPQLLDPQGKATLTALKQLDLQAINNVRIGKRIQLTVQANNEDSAKTIAQGAAKKLLINPITEVFELRVVQRESV